MKYAADFRREAREALRGKWVLAILAGVVAMLLGGTLSNGPQVNFSYSGGDLSANLQYAGQNIYAWGNGITPGLRAFFVGSAIYLVLAALVLAVLYFILGSVICVGYARFIWISPVVRSRPLKPCLLIFTTGKHWPYPVCSDPCIFCCGPCC